MDSKNIKFILFTIILLILSGLGVFFIFKIDSSPLGLFLSSQTPTPIPTEIPVLTETPTLVPTKKATISITPTATATATAKITVTPTATPTAIPTTATVSGFSIFKNTADAFSVQYSNSRKLYQDTESTGNRYTFYSSEGNFAVHVSPSGTWSWTNPNRSFSASLVISGKNTYRYDITTQTIVDLQSTTKNYTIQCVHNGKTAVKTECEAFIKSFSLL